MFKRYKIRSYEIGLLFRDGEFKGLLAPGKHFFVDLFNKIKVDVVSQREPQLVHQQLDMIVKSGALEGRAQVIDLKDHERALVWIDNRFAHIYPAGLYAFWTVRSRFASRLSIVARCGSSMSSSSISCVRPWRIACLISLL